MGSLRGLAPYAGIIIIQLAYCGSNILIKLALVQGLNYLVFIVYRHVIAMAILGPLAFLFERDKRPPLSLLILTKIFMVALFGVTIHQSVYYAGLEYTSPTVATALSNIIPALTFILAVLLRLEKFRIRSAAGRAKILGTMACVAGTLIFTFWKGYLFPGFVRRPLIVVHGHGTVHNKEDWIKGSALILTSYVAFSAWLILQAMVVKVYPAKLSMNTLICLFGTLQSSAIALIFERNTSSWRLDSNIKILTTIYCGTVISCLVYYLQTFCIGERGPVFVALFSPLLLVFVTIFSTFFLAERLHLGSLFGALIIILGLYYVLWGRSRELSANCEEKDGKEDLPHKLAVRLPCEEKDGREDVPHIQLSVSTNDHHHISK